MEKFGGISRPTANVFMRELHGAGFWYGQATHLPTEISATRTLSHSSQKNCEKSHF